MKVEVSRLIGEKGRGIVEPNENMVLSYLEMGGQMTKKRSNKNGEINLNTLKEVHIYLKRGLIK